MANSVIRLIASEIATTAALGVNLTNADIVSKLEAGPIGLLVKGCTSVGGICTDQSGNIYVSDVDEHVILKINEGGKISTYAGLAGTSGRNGTLTKVAALSARFNKPKGLACDRSGNIYVADSGNNQIRVIHDGYVSHLAGCGEGISGFTDGVGGAASFNNPTDVAVDRTGVVYVADRDNHSIRRVKSGTVYTVSGDVAGDTENVSSAANAAGANGIYRYPQALSVDDNGDIFVCDSGNYKIKLLKSTGWVYLFSGSGIQGKVKGTTSFNGRYNDLLFSDIDKSGNLYVIDNNSVSGSRLIRLNKLGIQNIVHDFTGATSYNNELTGVAVSPAGKLFVTIQVVDAYESSSSSSDGYSSESSSSSE